MSLEITREINESKDCYEVWDNDELIYEGYFYTNQDISDKEKYMIILANALGFEASALLNFTCFNEKNPTENYNLAKEIQENRWAALPDIDNETVKIWLDALLEGKNKMFVQELTVAEIKAEIEETKGSIDNYRIWGDKHAIIDCEEYIEVLEEMLDELTEEG